MRSEKFQNISLFSKVPKVIIKEKDKLKIDDNFQLYSRIRAISLQRKLKLEKIKTIQKIFFLLIKILKFSKIVEKNMENKEFSFDNWIKKLYIFFKVSGNLKLVQKIRKLKPIQSSQASGCQGLPGGLKNFSKKLMHTGLFLISGLLFPLVICVQETS